MPSDHTDRQDLYRLADDGCPHVPDPTDESKTHDLTALRAVLARDD